MEAEELSGHLILCFTKFNLNSQQINVRKSSFKTT
jgi:hypothetical protein